jgi:hypothetical protein
MAGGLGKPRAAASRGSPGVGMCRASVASGPPDQFTTGLSVATPSTTAGRRRVPAGRIPTLHRDGRDRAIREIWQRRNHRVERTRRRSAPSKTSAAGVARQQRCARVDPLLSEELRREFPGCSCRGRPRCRAMPRDSCQARSAPPPAPGDRPFDRRCLADGPPNPCSWPIPCIGRLRSGTCTCPGRAGAGASQFNTR